jgi:translation initiation factor IF-2
MTGEIKSNRLDPLCPLRYSVSPGCRTQGTLFQVTENERQARQIGVKRQELKKHEEAKNVKKITLDNLYDSIQDGEIQELKVIIKGDVHGSVEALQNALEKLSNKSVRLICISASAGAIVESDVYLASASNAIIVGFHVRPTPRLSSSLTRKRLKSRSTILFTTLWKTSEALWKACWLLISKKSSWAPSKSEMFQGTQNRNDCRLFCHRWKNYPELLCSRLS